MQRGTHDRDAREQPQSALYPDIETDKTDKQAGFPSRGAENPLSVSANATDKPAPKTDNGRGKTDNDPPRPPRPATADAGGCRGRRRHDPHAVLFVEIRAKEGRPTMTLPMRPVVQPRPRRRPADPPLAEADCHSVARYRLWAVWIASG